MIGFNMQQIKVDQFAILTDSIDKKDLGMQADASVAVDAEHRMVRLQMKFGYYVEEQLVLTFALSCFFAVDVDSWEMLKKDNKIILSHGFLAHLAMHTVGTARGILFCKTEGTPFQQIILPPLNVEKMFEEDIVIK